MAQCQNFLIHVFRGYVYNFYVVPSHWSNHHYYPDHCQSTRLANIPTKHSHQHHNHCRQAVAFGCTIKQLFLGAPLQYQKHFMLFYLAPVLKSLWTTFPTHHNIRGVKFCCCAKTKCLWSHNDFLTVTRTILSLLKRFVACR